MIISEHIIKFTMPELRNQRTRVRAGKQIKALTKYTIQMEKKGYKIENINAKERGYTGKGLFYGIKVLDN